MCVCSITPLHAGLCSRSCLKCNGRVLSRESRAPMRQLFVLFFSKNRPFQLREALRSFNKHAQYDASRVDVVQYVLYTSSSAMTTSQYTAVASSYPAVQFIPETSFGSDLMKLFDSFPVSDSSHALASILFVVDDVLFVRDFAVSEALTALSADTGVFSYQWKLHPGVWYNQPADSCCRRPTFSLVPTCPVSLAFSVGDGDGDWSYPWDLCGSMYRLSDAKTVVAELHAASALNVSHPNRLECSGHAHVMATRPGVRVCCPVQPVLYVITINRVQDVFENSVFSPGSSDSSSSLEELNALVADPTAQLDDAWYRSHDFPCVHIGALRLVGPVPAAPPSPHSPLVSVLMPAFNAAACIEPALSSLFHQCGFGPNEVEVVVVDDGSTDGTGDVVARVAAAQLAFHTRCIRLEDNSGVAAALNTGVR